MTVRVKAEGFEPVKYNTRINSTRQLDRAPPALEPEGLSAATWVAVMVVLILLAGVILLYSRRRDGTSARPQEKLEEPPPEDDAGAETDAGTGEQSEEGEAADLDDEGQEDDVETEGPEDTPSD